MGQIRAADYPGLNVNGSRWLYRRRIPRHLKPLAAELFGIRHEVTVSLGSNSDEVMSRYAAALDKADRQQKQLEAEFKRRSLHAISADATISGNLSPAPSAQFATPVWMPVDTEACRRTIERWKQREMGERHAAIVNGAVPDMNADYSLWSAWMAERSELLSRLQTAQAGGNRHSRPIIIAI